MRESTIVLLPSGIWIDDVRHQEAGLRPILGEDEAFLLDAKGALAPVQRASALLERCLTHIGSNERVTSQMVLNLTVGDREALLLHLRRLTFGERLQGVLRCPNPDCSEQMDLTLSVADLLQPPYRHAEPLYERTISVNGSAYWIQFCLPTGADQLAAIGVAVQDPNASVEFLIRRCIQKIALEEDKDERIERWPPEVTDHLAELMAELDPQAEIRLNLACPVCGHAFSTMFDTADYFYRELAERIERVYQEVHFLAFYYHWSETEIMEMTANKRRRYLELLFDGLKWGEAQ